MCTMTVMTMLDDDDDGGKTRLFQQDRGASMYFTCIFGIERSKII